MVMGLQASSLFAQTLNALDLNLPQKNPRHTQKASPSDKRTYPPKLWHKCRQQGLVQLASNGLQRGTGVELIVGSSDHRFEIKI